MSKTKRPPVPSLTDDEEAEIQAQIAADPDSPELTDHELSGLVPLQTLPADMVEAVMRNKGGRPKAEAPKIPVTLRLDPDVVAAYRATGDGWQTRMNDALRRGIDAPARRRA